MLLKYKDLCSNPNTHVTGQVWLLCVTPVLCSKTGGSQLSSRVSERPCHEGIKRRVIEQDSDDLLWLLHMTHRTHVLAHTEVIILKILNLSRVMSFITIKNTNGD